MYFECQSRGRLHIHTAIGINSEIDSTGKIIPRRNAPQSTSQQFADRDASRKICMLMHADVNMDSHEAAEEQPWKKMKLSNGDPLCSPQLNGWYTMPALENLLGKNAARIAASTAPKRFEGQGYDRPCVEQFLITDGGDAFKQLYVPPPGRCLI